MNNFYIQQEIYIFSNLKFAFSNMRFIFNNLRFAFKEMKLVKLKSFIFNKPNLDVTKYKSKTIRRKIWSVSCTSSLQVFSSALGTFFAHYRDDV